MPSSLSVNLSELLDSNTSPEMALQLLTTGFIPPQNYAEGHTEAVVIFLGYIKYIMNKRPDGKLGGIWDQILKNALKYLRGTVHIHNEWISDAKAIYPANECAWLVPELWYEIGPWVVEVLKSPNNCPNPYIRLEMYRLHMKLAYHPIAAKDDSDENINSLHKGFSHTIYEINPHNFYLSAVYLNNTIFNVEDLKCMLLDEQDYISSESLNDLNFLSKLIQLIRVFANRIRYNPNNYEDIETCIIILKYLRKKSNKFTHQSIQKYACEIVREITTATICISGRKTTLPYETRMIISKRLTQRIFCRDKFVKEIGLQCKSSDLPRLLLLRQIQGPRKVHRHALLLPEFSPFFKRFLAIQKK